MTTKSLKISKMVLSIFWMWNYWPQAGFCIHEMSTQIAVKNGN